MRSRIDPIPSIAIGPANYAGQATAWATAYKHFGSGNAISFSYSKEIPGFGYQTDRDIGQLRKLGQPSMRKVKSIAVEFDFIAIDGFVPLAGVGKMSSLRRQVRRLQSLGTNVLLISHGTDTRSPSRHMARVECSYFRESPRAYVARCESESRRNRGLPGQLGVPLLVSTPDLLIDNPGSQWLPVVVQPEKWEGAPAPFLSELVSVLHVPSRTNPPIKGTRHIDPVLTKLAEEGLIRYLRAESVPHEDMPAMVKQADVVVDQIQTGSYGVAAVEAMSAGRLVVGNVATDVRALISTDLPIVDSSPSELELVIRHIVAHRGEYTSVAASGPRYVAEFHNGRQSTQVLSSMLHQVQ